MYVDEIKSIRISRSGLLSLLLALSFLGFSACNENHKRVEARRIVAEWTGKTIQYPADVQCSVMGKDTVPGLCSALLQKEYKILLYVDSTGCSDCRLKLFQWKQLIEEADSLFRGEVGFLFFFQPKDKKEMGFLIRRDRFDYPVFIDVNNTIDQFNRFPRSIEYQCFLLDKNNKVLMIGNPSLNPKIWELYKRQISGQEQTNTRVTSVSVEQSEIEITGLQVDKKSEVVFKLKNEGDQPLLISHVDASCGCTVPFWEKKPIAPGKVTEIKVGITPEEAFFFRKTIRVYCNDKNGVILLVIKGEVSQKVK